MMTSDGGMPGPGATEGRRCRCARRPLPGLLAGRARPPGDGRVPASPGAHHATVGVAVLGPRNRPEAWIHRRLVIPDPTISLTRAA